MAGLWTLDIDWDEDAEPWDVADNKIVSPDMEIDSDFEDNIPLDPDDDDWDEDADLDSIAVTYPELN